jgi:Programmed cell death protein 2, C-terminal putative domain
VNGTCYWAVSDTALPRLCFVQVYAPTAVPRSLCIFGCNTPTCSISPQGWRVLRTTASHAEPPASLHVNTKAAEIAAEPEPELSWGAPAGDDWSTPAAAAADDWGAGDSSSDWGSSVTAATDSIATLNDTLAQLLINREAATTAAAAEQKAQPPAPPTAARKAVQQGSTNDELPPHTFPAFDMVFYPEPWGSDSSSSSNSKSEDASMAAKIRAYLAEEEDTALAALIGQTLTAPGHKGARSSSSSSSSSGSSESAIAAAAAAAASSSGEAYESTPAALKAVLKFAERVRRAPYQAVRYAYGGQPLWCGAAGPQLRRAPPSCACGAERVFELQLMPSLLFTLQCDAHAANATATTTGATAAAATAAAATTTAAAQSDEQEDGEFEGEQQRASGAVEAEALPVVNRAVLDAASKGMDWGVVTVWCCPDSCALSCEECVIVQPPPT